MKKLIFTTILATVAGVSVYAQQDLQVGANIGETMGVTAKFNLNYSSAIEGVLGYNLGLDGPLVKMTYQYHFPIVDALQAYVGAGASLGVYDLTGHDENADFSVGIVPVIGLEYKLRTAPFVVGFAYEPIINLMARNSNSDVAFKVRYRF